MNLFPIMINYSPMARPLRVEFHGAMYHVIARGNAKQKIFLNDHDRQEFLRWLGYVQKMYNLVIYAYCLMGNHYHLLVETPDANLSKAMRDLNGNYSQGFNKRHKRVGHLLQGRYKAFVVEKHSYLLELIRYIILNPIRACLVKHPRDWKWSSYGATAGHVKAPEWLYVDETLSLFSKNRQTAQREYRQFVKDGIGGEDPHDKVSHGFILGDLYFVHAIWEKTNGAEDLKEHPREERIVGRPTLLEIFADVKTKEERNEAIVFARGRCGYLTTEIAPFAGIHRAVVGRIARGVYEKKVHNST